MSLRRFGNPWTILRIVLIAANIYYMSSYPSDKSNVDWPLGAMVGLVNFIALRIWLTLMRRRSRIDWSEPYSWTGPFFPMGSYPTRFWFLCSLSLIAGGVAAIIREMVLGSGREGFGGTFVLWGIGVFFAVITFKNPIAAPEA
ncbi:MAG TPA: hypothetical protein VGR14_20105 [Verrucomicrobiae bacterium]|jgi:hypothetical protein|nr:hypothetical protein [Verrucomicrobiae bacterium]